MKSHYLPRELAYPELGEQLDDLYKNGLQRSDFLPFIKHIKENYDVIGVDSETDYRRLALNQSKTYFTPINRDSEEEFNLLFNRLVDISNTVSYTHLTLPTKA